MHFVGIDSESNKIVLHFVGIDLEVIEFVLSR